MYLPRAGTSLVLASAWRANQPQERWRSRFLHRERAPPRHNRRPNHRGAAAIILAPGQSVRVVCDNANRRITQAPSGPFGIARTATTAMGMGAGTIGTANHTRYYRVEEGARISKVRRNISAQVGTEHLCVKRSTRPGWVRRRYRARCWRAQGRSPPPAQAYKTSPSERPSQ